MQLTIKLTIELIDDSIKRKLKLQNKTKIEHLRQCYFEGYNLLPWYFGILLSFPLQNPKK